MELFDHERIEVLQGFTRRLKWACGRPVGESFDCREFAFDAEDPEQVYGALIDTLVTRVTSDFRATRVREPIAR